MRSPGGAPSGVALSAISGNLCAGGYPGGLPPPGPRESIWTKMKTQSRFRSFMEIALEEARAAGAQGRGARGRRRGVARGCGGGPCGQPDARAVDPTAHAEVLALRTACAAAGSERLPGHDLYVTLEPCPMCAAAISFARVARLYYGAADPKSGGVAFGARVFGHRRKYHRPEVYDGIGGAEAETLLKGFFAGRRE